MSSALSQVPDRVLSWLHSSLQREYRDVNRTYSDTARALSVHPYLQPQTEVYTLENGTSALLLQLKGLIPVSFRGTTYRFPISLWIPHLYPYEPPMLYVIPSQGLAIRPGQHVSVEGRIYHPYLADWPSQWDRSNLLDCIGIVQEVFAKEPPLVARSQHQDQQQQQQQQPVQADGRLVDSPQLRRGVTQSPQPPPPPPKPPEAGGLPARSSSLRHGYQNSIDGPPLPPKPAPPEGLPTRRTSLLQQQMATPDAHLRSPNHGAEGPPPPPLPKPEAYDAFGRPISMPQRSAQHPSATPHQRQWQTQTPAYGQSQQYTSPVRTSQHQQAYTQHSSSQQFPQQQQPPQYNANPKNPQPSKPGFAQPSRQPPKPNIPDLMSLDDALPLNEPAPLPAPPIPPNPEKDALLHAISVQLRTLLEQNLSQNAAAIPALHAQQSALNFSLHNMSQELTQLQELSATLHANERILAESTRTADAAIAEAKTRKPPDIDEVLVAPTVVGEQLYRVVAEVRGIEEALFAVAKAVERGRIESGVFVRTTRALAREQFLLKALGRKIASGMGLEGGVVA